MLLCLGSHPNPCSSGRAEGEAHSWFHTCLSQVTALGCTSPGCQPQTPGKGGEAEELLGADGSGTRYKVQNAQPGNKRQSIQKEKSMWEPKVTSLHSGLSSDQVLTLLHPLSTKCITSGRHSLRKPPWYHYFCYIIITKPQELSNAFTSQTKQSKIVKCINKPADKSSHLSLLA